jgi:hypothetical protein
MLRPASNLVVIATLILCLGLAGAGDPPGSGRVGRFGDLTRLPLEGCNQVSPTRVRQALRRDVAVQVASAPSAPMAEFLSALKVNLLAAYYGAGFPFATVNVRLDDQQNPAAVVVVEGERYRRGDVQVDSAKSLDAAALVALLTTAAPGGLFEVRIDPLKRALEASTLPQRKQQGGGGL